MGTCWVACYTQEEFRPVLDIPEDKYVVCVLTVGYPDETPDYRPRKRLKEIVHYEMVTLYGAGTTKAATIERVHYEKW